MEKMSRFRIWAREVAWLNVLAVVCVLLAVVLGFVAIFVASWGVLALVLGFCGITLALLGLR